MGGRGISSSQVASLLPGKDFVRLPGEKFSFEVKQRSISCNAMQCNALHLSIYRSISDRCQAVPVSIDAHEAFRGATGVNAQILLHGCICEEPTLILRGTLHDGAFRSRFWISIVEFCCAKKVFEWNSLEAHPTHPCDCCFFLVSCDYKPQ